MAVETTKLMTADELLAMPHGRGQRYELVRGELITMSPAGADHSSIAALILTSLTQYVRERKLGRTYAADAGFLITRNPDTVRAPDAAFVGVDRAVKTTRFFPGPPDLAVEVVSPNDTYSEVDAKVREYLEAGTQVVLVVDAQRQTASKTTAEATTRLTIDDALDGGDVVPGWRLPLRELFD